MHQEIHVKMTFDTNGMNCYIINIARELIKKSEKIGNAHIVTISVSKETKRTKVKIK